MDNHEPLWISKSLLSLVLSTKNDITTAQKIFVQYSYYQSTVKYWDCRRHLHVLVLDIFAAGDAIWYVEVDEFRRKVYAGGQSIYNLRGEVGQSVNRAHMPKGGPFW